MKIAVGGIEKEVFDIGRAAEAFNLAKVESTVGIGAGGGEVWNCLLWGLVGILTELWVGC